MDGLAEEPDRLRRRLIELGALTARLAPQGIEPILVGGCALELYTDGGYGTADVDLALPQGPQVDRAFAELGFGRRGRFWVRPELELYFEAPAPAGLPGETAPRTGLDLDGLRVVVLGVEDLLIDRLRAWVHRKGDEDGRWADILAAEPSGRVPGRRPRDPEQERLLTELDRSRIAQSDLLARSRRVPVEPDE